MNTTATKKHPAIAITPCESSRICGYGWDEGTSTLAMQFFKKGDDGKPVAGPIYHYAGVTKDVFADLQKAESIGRFFGQVIQSKDDDGNLNYPFERVEPATEDER